MSGDSYMESDFYNNSAYTADISTKMRVPDRLMAHGENTMMGDKEKAYMDGETYNEHLYGMQVPDRILVAGSEGHIPTKSTGPRELFLERSVMPPTPENVRVQTPPRSIKLDDVQYPTPTASEDVKPSEQVKSRLSEGVSKGRDRTGSVEFHDTSLRVVEGGGESLSVFEEVQMMRRQIAKLNHRLMAVELENQQQQQRETVLTVLVTGYFLVKVLLWVNKSM